MHAGNGILGIVLLGFMAQPDHVAALTGSPCGGLFYMRGDSRLGWTQLGMQLMGELCVCVCCVLRARTDADEKTRGDRARAHW